MARKSRKATGVQVVSSTVTEAVYNTALYIRLSIMDSGKKDSESIINQQELLESYIAQRSEFKLYDIFIDNGETGVDFMRPAWSSLMKECRAGKVDCIVIKDLSRLGRNYIETGDYLERIFPMMGIRLIAVTDNYDNLNLTNGERLVSGLKNLVNDIYAKDISRKVCAAMRTKQKNGEFIGSLACYGYLKDSQNKNKLVINPETAPVVRQIFEWKAEGVGNTTICQRLEAQGVPSPSKYKYLKGIVKSPKFANRVWIAESVARILRNTTYLGHMSQGKHKGALYESKPLKEVRRDDWIIVENTHESIVSQELFDTVNTVLEEKNVQYKETYGRHNHLKRPSSVLQGLVFCAECGKALKRLNSVNNKKDKISWHYECRLYKSLKHCAKKSIGEADLYDAVYGAIKLQLQACGDISSVIDKLNHEHSYKAGLSRYDAEIEDAEKEIRRIESLRKAIFEDYATKLITASEYKFANEKYTADADKLQEHLKQAKLARSQHSQDTSVNNKWLATFKKFIDDKELTTEMTKTLIERIDVHEGHNIEIAFRYQDEFVALSSMLNKNLGVSEVAM